MEELQIMQMENSDITAWDLPAIKEELQRQLDAYAGLVYTPDTIKDAKNDRALLNKTKKVIEDARKAYKAKCLAPYEAIEPQIKELTNMVERQRVLIDETVKEFEARQKEMKEQEVRAYYDRKSSPLGSFADALYSKLFDPKWVNSSTTKAKYEVEIQTAINNAVNDLDAIKSMDSPFVDTLIDLYIETLSMDEVNAKKDELSAAVSKAGLATNEEPSTPVVTESSLETKAPVAEEKQEDGVAMKIFATENQMNQITDFMKAIGVRYEFL